MEQERIQQLLDRMESGLATETEIMEIERLVEAGTITLEQMESYAALEKQIIRLGSPAPSASLDDRFYQMLSEEKGLRRSAFWKPFFSLPEFAPRLALASLMLVAGIAAGYFLRLSATSPSDKQIANLSQQVSDLQEMMMLSLLEKGSPTERLKAVNLTQEMSEASQKVTTALIQTLNNDQNINVRLAALEALKPYVRDSSVRGALIQSISRQQSPLVQISLAELMVALQEKGAVEEFQRIVDSEKTPSEVKEKIRESIRVLI